MHVGDVMDKITKMGAMGATVAIWKYDPNDSNNRVSGGSINVICNVWAIAVKVFFLPFCYLKFILKITRFRSLGNELNILNDFNLNTRSFRQ